MLYKEPEIKSYSAGDIMEELGPCQNQYVEQTATLNPNEDGYMTFNGSTYTLDSSGSTVMVGDTNANAYMRGFFSFDISSLQSTVVSATLRVNEYSYGAGVSAFVPLYVDHVNFGTLVAGAADFNGNDLTRSYTSTNNYDTGWKEFNVGSAVQADINARRTTSQFRLRFNVDTDSDSSYDNINFYSVEASGSRPQLVVTYRYRS